MEEEINNIIKFVNCNNFKIILARRDKNIIFCKKYNIDIDMIRYILSKININNFVDILENENDKYGDSYLYVFAPYVNNLKDKVYSYKQIYLKIKIFFDKGVLVIISLHEARYELNYYFRGDYDD